MKLLWNGKTVKTDDAQTITSLIKGCYGKNKKGVISLGAEEALYLIDIRGAECNNLGGKKLKFNELASKFKKKKLLARYLTYKDWRDRGLFITEETDANKKYKKNIKEKYGRGKWKLEIPKINAEFYPEDLMCIIDNAKIGEELYKQYWIGQMGTYKSPHRGSISKLDIFETLFLINAKKLNITNVDENEIFEIAKKRIGFFEDMNNVYLEWRNAGYIVKTGFKFGTNFRIYLPGAKPEKGENWVHSKHVLHAFPRKSSLIISEWARAIRVAHSVKKTFILAIPGEGEIKKGKVDFALYHRKRGGVYSPKDGEPSFLMLSLSEDEYLSGEELASSLKTASERGLNLLIAIVDRESSVTYYLVKQIELPGSKYEYYEIEWMQP